MRSADDIRRLFKNAELGIHPGADERVFEDVLKARQKMTENRPALPENMWRVIMKSPLTKLAVAAAVLIAGVIGLSLWRTTGSGIALAEVLARVEQVKAWRSTGSYTSTRQKASGKPGGFEARFTILGSQEYGFRLNGGVRDPNGGWIPLSEDYVSLQKKTFTSINTPEKKYVRVKLGDAGAQAQQKMFGPYGDPVAIIKGIMACKYENLGRSTINGVEVEGFHTTDPNCRSPLTVDLLKNQQLEVKLWVDVKTRLPVRSEGLTSGRDEGGNTISHHLVNNFEWDVPVTAADFDPPPVPDGYTVVNGLDDRDEETAIRGLKQCIELFGSYLFSAAQGEAETLLSAFQKSETPTALRLKEEVRGLTEKEKRNKLATAAWDVRRFMMFYRALFLDKKDPFYFGTFVTPKDTDKVLLRWKLSDSEYRVIFGDLHAETVSPEKLAELEAAVLDNPPGLLNEETAILGMKQCVGLVGNYLETIKYGEDAMGMLCWAYLKSETPAAKKMKELTGEQRSSSELDAEKPIFRLMWFYVRLVQDKKDPAYYGKTVTPKDADKVLMRWKVSDNEYRVIFGDLHAETVSPEKLAELEAALSK